MWEVLTERLHHSGAAQIVFECLQARLPHRLKELLRIVELHVNDAAIVWVHNAARRPEYIST